MKFTVRCPKCGISYKLSVELAGRQATCKKCGQRFQLPSVSPGAAPAPAPEAAPPESNDAFGDLSSDAVWDELDMPAEEASPLASTPKKRRRAKQSPASTSGVKLRMPKLPSWKITGSGCLGSVITFILIYKLVRAVFIFSDLELPSPSAPTERNLAGISTEEYMEYAEELKENGKENSSALVAIHPDDIGDMAFQAADLSREEKQRLQRWLHEDYIGAMVHRAPLTRQGSSRLAELVGVRDIAGRTVLMYRLTGDEPPIYWGLVLRQKRGFLSPCDAYDSGAGCFYSGLFVDLLRIEGEIRESRPSFEVGGPSYELERAWLNRRDDKDVIECFEKMPPELQDFKPHLEWAMASYARLGEKGKAAELHARWMERYDDRPAAGFPLLAYYEVIGDDEAYNACLDRFASEIGGDPYLEDLRK